MPGPIRVLVVEDSAADVDELRRNLVDGAYEPVLHQVRTAEALRACLAAEPWDLVVSAYVLEDLDGLTALSTVQGSGQDLPFIFLTGAVPEDVAVEAMVRGAHDCVLKDHRARLLPAIERELAKARTRREQRHNETLYRALIESANDAVFLYEAEADGSPGRFVAVNDMACEQLGYTRDELLTMSPADFDAPDVDLAEVRDKLARNGQALFEAVHQTKAGRRLPVEVSARLLPVSNQRLVLSIARDLTTRHQIEEERRATIEILRLLNRPNDLHGAIREVTACLQRWSDCEAVGIRLRAGEDYPYFETRGFPAEFVAAESSLCVLELDGQVLRDEAGHPVLECICGNILGGRFDPSLPFFTAHGSFWTNSTTDRLASTTEADRQARTRNRCHGEGYESVALIPLRVGSETLGLLQLNDHRRDRFTADGITLLERLADNLAAALSRLTATALLEASETRFRELFERMKSGVAVYRAVDDGADFVIENFNRAAERIEATPRAEVLGRRVTEAFPGVADLGLMEVFRRVWRTGEPADHPAGLYRDKSLVGWRENHVYKLPSGEVVAIYDDVTGREVAHREREAQTRFLASLLEAIPAPVFYKDANGVYLGCNRAFEALVGRPRAEIIDHTALELWPASVGRVYTEADRALFASPGSQIYEAEVRDSAGQSRACMFHKATFENELGEVAGLIGVILDITDRIALEEQLRHAQRIESIGRLAGGIAHDLNNLLTPIIGYAEFVLEGLSPDAPHRSDSLEILRAANRARDLTRQLLAFARRQTLELRPVDLVKVVTDFEQLLRRVLRADVKLDLQLPDTAGAVLADVGQLEQVLMNLAINAQDAMPAGGVLTIAVASTTPAKPDGEPTADLCVTDTGHGMDEETLRQVFEPFFTTKPAGQGTGLGLAVIQGIIAQHNGTIRVESELGQGTTFCIRLPQVEQSPTSAQPSVPDQPAEAGRTGTIMLVDDDEGVRRLAARLLSHQGHTVLAASSAEDCLSQCAAERPDFDLLVTDVAMTGLSGLDLYRRLAAERPGLRVLFVSGYDQQVLINRGALEPGMALLAKPFSPSSLRNAVRELLAE